MSSLKAGLKLGCQRDARLITGTPPAHPAGVFHFKALEVYSYYNPHWRGETLGSSVIVAGE